MREVQMKKLISEALGRGCNCETGGKCPDLWHTWSRMEGRGASCFTGKDGGYQRGVFKLNLDDDDIETFLNAAKRYGFWANKDGDNQGLRVLVSLGKNPSLDKIEMCERWIRKTKGAFTSEKIDTLI